MPGPAPDETRHAPPGTGSNTPPPAPGLPDDGPPTAVLVRPAAPALAPPAAIDLGPDPGPPTGLVAPPPDPERTGAAHVPVILHPNEMFPEVGSRLLHFEVMEELGRGSFARVYLARQESLANRLVVLKVTQDATDEPQKLARLRHTNIVPVYSVHEAGPFQAVCMPYLGRVTLSRVLADLAAGAARRPATGWALLGTLFGDRGSTAAATGSDRPPGKTDPEPSSGPDPDDPPPTQVAAVNPFSTANAPPDIQTGLAAPPYAGGGWLKTPGRTNAPLPDGPDETSETLEAVRELSFVGAALWLTARLAAGLAHAHARGILHRDLKPANVLVTDDGVPMLLDFNVSVDTTLPDGGRVGGTMRYMAPEHLRAFGGDSDAVVDERSDLYALGLILYELLTGTLPFAPNPRALLAVREQPPPRPGLLNPAVTPAVDSIVLKLLHPHPAARYASAHDLRDDLGRQLRDRPLRFAPERSVRERAAKWKRRNPGLATAAAVGLFALAFLILPAGAVAAVKARQAAAAKENQRLTEEALTAAESEKERLAAENARAMQAEAEKKYHTAAADLRDAAVQLASRSDSSARDQGVALARAALARYGVGADTGWAARPDFALLPAGFQAELKELFGEVLILLTRADLRRPNDPDALADAARWNAAAPEMFPPGEAPDRVARQRDEVAARMDGRPAPRAEAGEPRTDADRYFAGLDLLLDDRHAAALPHLARFTDARPDHFRAWFARGVCHDVLNQPAEAAVAFAVCCALRPNFPLAHVNRGLARLKLRKYADAETDLTQALSLRPGWAPALVNRGLARDAQRRHADAVADFDAVLADPAAPTRVLLLRSRARRAAGDAAGADADLAAFRARTPADAPSWAARGTLRMANEQDAALADFDAALAVNPNYRDALLNKGVLLADHLHRPADAARVLDHLLDLYPDHIEARAGRGVYLARTGDAARARADGAAVIRAEPTAFRFYQVAGLHAQLAKDDPGAKAEALRLLGRAFRAGFADFAMLKTDTDLDPIRDDPAFRDLVAAAAKLGGK